MTDQEKRVMQIVKRRLGIAQDDTTDDALIETFIMEIGYRIKHYCQRNDIPNALEFVWASMVTDALGIYNPAEFGVGEGGLNIKIGDTSIGPASNNDVTNSSKEVINEIVLNYMADLHRWRKLRW